MPVNFQPSRIFVEYHSQFLLISSEIRTIGLGLEIHVGIDTKGQNFNLLNSRSKLSITYTLRLEYNNKKKKIQHILKLTKHIIHQHSV